MNMTQKRISHLLIAAGALACAGVLVLAGVYAPALAGEALEANAEVPGIRGLYWMGLIGVWAVAALFLLALAEFFFVCVRIGKEQSFCTENVKSLKRIALYMALCGALWIGAIFAPSFFFHILMGPVWIFFLLFSMAHSALALLALGLSRLLARAVDMQQENDLTV